MSIIVNYLDFKGIVKFAELRKKKHMLASVMATFPNNSAYIPEKRVAFALT